MQSAPRQSLAGLQGRQSSLYPALSWNSRRAPGVCSSSFPSTCAQNSSGEELRRIRFRKGLVSFKERQLQRTRQTVLPAIEAAADAEQQVAWAAGNKLERAARFLDFRRWTARGKGLVLLNLLVVLCASNWVVVKDCEHSFDPYLFAFFRFTVAALAFSPFLGRAFRSKRIWRGGLELGFWMALGYLTQAQGLISTDASRASFISTFTVLVVPILAGVSGKAQVKPLTYFSALAALAGVALLVEKGGVIMPSAGDLWSLASAIFFGVQVFRTEIISRRLSKDATWPLMASALGTVAVVSAVAVAVTHPNEVQNMLALPGRLHAMLAGGVPWWQILYTGLMSTDAVLMIEVVALHDVSSTDAALIYSMEPVLGAGLAYMVLGERWGQLGWLGAGLIIASSLVAQIMGTEEPEQAAAAPVAVPATKSAAKVLKSGSRKKR